MRAMWLRPWSREVRAAVPADPPPPSGPSSRSAPEAAGWGHPPAGPTPTPPAPASPVRRPQRRAGPPASATPPTTSAARGCAASTSTPATQAWPHRRATGSSPASPTSTASPWRVLGDPGEGDASQYAVVPVLLSASPATPTSPWCAATSSTPAGGRAVLRRPLLPPLRRLPGADLRAARQPRLVRRPHRLHDGLLRRAARRRRAATRGHGPALAAGCCAGCCGGAPRGRRAEDVADMRWYRDAESQQTGGQPGPYCAIDAGPRAAGADRHRDRRAGSTATRPSGCAPCRRGTGRRSCSRAGRSTPTRALQPSPIDGGGDVNEIVTDPRYNYVAAIGGDDHNYQRYPVRQRDGRTIQYVVAGGSGALSLGHAPDPERRPARPGGHRGGLPLLPAAGRLTGPLQPPLRRAAGARPRAAGDLAGRRDDAHGRARRRSRRPARRRPPSRGARPARRRPDLPVPRAGRARAELVSLLFDSNACRCSRASCAWTPPPRRRPAGRPPAARSTSATRCWRTATRRPAVRRPLEWRSETPGAVHRRSASHVIGRARPARAERRPRLPDTRAVG